LAVLLTGLTFICALCVIWLLIEVVIVSRFPFSILMPAVIGLSACLVAWLVVSDSIQKWLDRDRFFEEIELGKASLREGDIASAALAFQRALVYRDSWRAHYGLAFCLEKLGQLEVAVSEYRAAKRISYWCGRDVFAPLASEHIRALTRLGTDDANEIALEAARDALAFLGNDSGADIDEIKLRHAIVLLSLRREAEARIQFEGLARSSSDSEIRRAAESFERVGGLIQLAELGPDVFFSMISKGEGSHH
jgi:tetratricopeptide (TPR) repeat protein